MLQAINQNLFGIKTMEPISLYLVQFNILECQSETIVKGFGSEGVFPPVVKQTKLVPYAKPFL